MDTIMAIAREHKLFVIEDAAQGLMSCYYAGLRDLDIQTSQPPMDLKIEHNRHISFIMAPGDKQPYLQALRDRGINATSHHEPLHAADIGQKHGRVSGSMAMTDRAKQCSIRLPLYVVLTDTDVDHIISSVEEVFA